MQILLDYDNRFYIAVTVCGFLGQVNVISFLLILANQHGEREGLTRSIAVYQVQPGGLAPVKDNI